MTYPRATVTFTARIANKLDRPSIPGGYLDGHKLKVFTADLVFDGQMQVEGEPGARHVIASAGCDFTGWTPLSHYFEPMDPNRADQVYEFYRWLEKQPDVTLVEHVPLTYEIPGLPPNVASLFAAGDARGGLTVGGVGATIRRRSRTWLSLTPPAAGVGLGGRVGGQCDGKEPQLLFFGGA